MDWELYLGTVLVNEASPQARGLYDVSGNASGLYVTYTSPPASGDVRLYWQAGPSSIATLNAQSGIYTITSGSTLTGTLSGSTNWVDVKANKTEYRYIIYPDEHDSNKTKVWSTVSGYNVYQDSGGGHPELPIQQALTDGVDTYVRGGTYSIASGATPIDYPQSKVFRFHMAKDALFLAPPGHTSPLFRMGYFVTNCEFLGGRFKESGSNPARNSFPIEMVASGAGGNFFNTIGEYYCSQMKAMVKISAYASGRWMSSNLYRNMTGWDDKYAVEFHNNPSTSGDASTHFYEQRFENIALQTDGATIRGVLDVQGQGHSFRNVMIWDLQTGNSGAGARSCNILSGATRTKIQGGGTMGSHLITYPELDDSQLQDTIIETYDNDSRDPRLVHSTFDAAYKEGGCYCAFHTYWGILDGLGTNMSGTSTAVGTITNTLGNVIRWTTGAVSGNMAGRRFGAITMRQHNPKMSIRPRLGTVPAGDMLAWFGFNSSTAEWNGNTEANSNSVFMIGFRTTDTNYQVIHNAGAATAGYIDTGISAANTSGHTIELMADEDNTRWLWRVDKGGFQEVTSGVPAATTQLAMGYGIQTNAASSKTWDMMGLEFKVKRF